MARTRAAEAVVLRAHDVGEADRFCILFTREWGRLAARAVGARRPGSRLGGALLPFRSVSLELRERGEGFVVTAARLLDAAPSGLPAFARLGEGVETLLQLTEDGEPMPEVFALLRSFLASASAPADPVPAFLLRLSSLLGLLPSEASDPRFAALPPMLRDYVRLCAAGRNAPCPNAAAVRRFCDAVLGEHLRSPLKSRAASAALAA